MSFLGRMWSWLSVRSINPSRKKCATRTASLDVGLRGILTLRERTVSETRAWARQPAHAPASHSPAPGRTSERVPVAKGPTRWAIVGEHPASGRGHPGTKPITDALDSRRLGCAPCAPFPRPPAACPSTGLQQASLRPAQPGTGKGRGSIPRLPPARQSNRDQNGERLRPRPLRFTCSRSPGRRARLPTRELSTMGTLLVYLLLDQSYQSDPFRIGAQKTRLV